MKFPILALLSRQPAHGYELKQALEQRFDGVLPPLNAGQVYTTLQRLQRDGLGAGGRIVPEDRPTKGGYALTDAGQLAVRAWLETPTAGARLKDEFFMKLALAGAFADPQILIDRQRRTYLQALHDLDRLAGNGGPDGMTRLLIEGAALHLEADLKWLDLCEQRLVRKEDP